MSRLVLLGTTLGLLAAGCGGGETPALPEGRSLTASSSVTPPVALFGDPIVARVDVLLDRDELDPSRVRFEPSFEPYERLGEPQLERRDLGRFTRLHFEFRVRCIALDCIEVIGGGPAAPQPGGIPPPTTGAGGFGERKTIRLKTASMSYDDPRGETRVLRRVTWPKLQSVSRLNFADTEITGIGFPFRADVTPLPEATFRISPGLLGAALLAGALALLVFPIAVVRRARRREPTPVEAPEPELTPLERALALVEWARDRPDGADRRAALEVLAAELDAEGRVQLAQDTRGLAWSAAPPSPEAAQRLLETVKEIDGTSD